MKQLIKPSRPAACAAAILIISLTLGWPASGQDRPILESPPFLKVGEWYVALYTGEERRPLHFKVLERAGGAWLKVEYRDEVMWLNTNAALLIKPGTPE